MARRLSQGEFFNVDYGISSAIIGTGNTIIATTQCAYHGMAVVALSNTCTITVYDNKSTGLGNVIDKFTLFNTSTSRDRNIPIVARNGIVIVATGSGFSGTAFYGPKG